MDAHRHPHIHIHTRTHEHIDSTTHTDIQTYRHTYGYRDRHKLRRRDTYTHIDRQTWFPSCPVQHVHPQVVLRLQAQLQHFCEGEKPVQLRPERLKYQ